MKLPLLASWLAAGLFAMAGCASVHDRLTAFTVPSLPSKLRPTRGDYVGAYAYAADCAMRADYAEAERYYAKAAQWVPFPGTDGRVFEYESFVNAAWMAFLSGNKNDAVGWLGQANRLAAVNRPSTRALYLRVLLGQEDRTVLPPALQETLPETKREARSDRPMRVRDEAEKAETNAADGEARPSRSSSVPSYLRQYAEGDSMLPDYPTGCSFLIDVSPDAFSRARCGASIVWRRSDGRAIHHAIRRVFVLGDQTVLLTESRKGRCLDDELVTQANFIGLVVEGTVREEPKSLLATIPFGSRAQGNVR